MRVVHVLSSLGRGGQERVAFDLCVEMKNFGVHSTVMTLEPGEPGSMKVDFEDAGVAVKHLPKREGFDVALMGKIGRYLRKTGAQLVHTHNPQPLIYAAGATRVVGAKLVHTKHGVNPGKSLWLRKTAAKACHAFVSVSQKTQEVAEAAGEGPRGRCHMIENGIDTNRFENATEHRSAIREQLSIPQTAFCVGTVGRLDPEKGHAFFIQSLASALGTDFHLVLVGDGPERANLEKLVRDLNVESFVHLTGLQRDVPRYVGAFDCFALTSVREGLPLVIPESMAAGLPVVATNVGGVHRVVDSERTGFLIASGDEKALMASIEKLRRDPTLRTQMGEAGRELVNKQFSVARMAKDYYRLYKQVQS